MLYCLLYVEPTDSNGNVGGSPSLALADQGLAHISYTDVSNRDLKYAYALSPIPLTSVTIAGPDFGLVGGEYTFLASVEPLSTTLPLTYTWQASDQALVTDVSGITTTIPYAWNPPGMKSITLTASNSPETVTATQGITIAEQTRFVHLPLILKNHGGGANTQVKLPISPVFISAHMAPSFAEGLFTCGLGVGWIRKRRAEQGAG
jgi:hypothetical protein